MLKEERSTVIHAVQNDDIAEVIQHFIAENAFHWCSGES